MPISWFPRNFTNPEINLMTDTTHLSDDTLYGVQLGLYVIGYRESLDHQVRTVVRVGRELTWVFGGLVN